MTLPQLIPHVVSDFTPHWDLTLSNDAYHSDKTAISSTSLRRILRSPYSFLAGQAAAVQETNAMNFGSAVHMALLEPEIFYNKYVVMPPFEGIGSVKKRADWRLGLEKDAIILKQEEYNDLQEMINSVLRHKDACNILKNGKAEMSGYYADPETGIKCRIRPDFFCEGHMALVDVKTTKSVEASEFSKAIWNYRYDFQCAMYCEGIRLITGKKVEYPLFIVLEKQPPFECAVYMADPGMLLKGEMDYRMALNRLRVCIDTQSWDTYQSRIQPISLPTWALKETL